MTILPIVTDGSHLQTFVGVLFRNRFPSTIRILFLSSVLLIELSDGSIKLNYDGYCLRK